MIASYARKTQKPTRPATRDAKTCGEAQSYLRPPQERPITTEVDDAVKMKLPLREESIFGHRLGEDDIQYV